MVKKDYVLIADSIVEWHNKVGELSHEKLSYDVFTRFIDIISKRLEDDNKKFDNKKFTRYIIERLQP